MTPAEIAAHLARIFRLDSREVLPVTLPDGVDEVGVELALEKHDLVLTWFFGQTVVAEDHGTVVDLERETDARNEELQRRLRWRGYLTEDDEVGCPIGEPVDLRPPQYGPTCPEVDLMDALRASGLNVTHGKNGVPELPAVTPEQERQHRAERLNQDMIATVRAGGMR